MTGGPKKAGSVMALPFLGKSYRPGFSVMIVAKKNHDDQQNIV
jgi:hypothetical protein